VAGPRKGGTAKEEFQRTAYMTIAVITRFAMAKGSM